MDAHAGTCRAVFKISLRERNVSVIGRCSYNHTSRFKFDTMAFTVEVFKASANACQDPTYVMLLAGVL